MSRAVQLRRLERLAEILDSGWTVPGLGLRVGLDSLVGLLPVGGDLAMTLPALYIVWRSRRMGAPWRLIGRMMVNVLFDLVIGSVPVAGDIADLFWKANQRNVRLLRRHLEKQGNP